MESKSWQHRLVSYILAKHAPQNKSKFFDLRRDVKMGFIASLLAEIGITAKDPYFGRIKEQALIIARIVCFNPKHKQQKLGEVLKELLTTESGDAKFRQFLSSHLTLASHHLLGFAMRAKSEGKALNLYELADVIVKWDMKDFETNRFYVREALCDAFYADQNMGGE